MRGSEPNNRARSVVRRSRRADDALLQAVLNVIQETHVLRHAPAGLEPPAMGHSQRVEHDRGSVRLATLREWDARTPARIIGNLRGNAMNSHEVTIKDLEDWVQSGGHWRVVDISRAQAAVDLLTCTSEPLERRETHDPSVIGYLRTAHTDLDRA
jgi:hypothetical protein